ncbi:hypothetical protein ACU6HM_10525 [Alcaligenes sp. RM2]|uniref:hypothetical protein n=1 Tax=unclassified Alcaligenes TaxID=259357 RepID=UPI0020C4AB1E|nr:hypothetical protein [Alcaligenes sp. NLF5-7]UTM02363.1 hypothetical protein MID00_02805 [Alcaligenes sp. NLF5-7]
MTLGFPCWDQAPVNWDWLAQDEDGQWFWYGVQPSPGIGGGVWRSPSRLQQFAARGEPNPSWMHSLYQRPDLPDKKRST